MKHYYGLIDAESGAWGFIDETDDRRTDDMIELTESEWLELLNAQMTGLEIVCYEGKVFTAERNKYYADDNGEWQARTDEEAAQITAEEKAERINNLTMTPLDFINFLVDSGLTLEQVNTYLEANLSVKMRLTYCQNVYCGAAKALMPITVDDITITADMVEEAFLAKNENN